MDRVSSDKDKDQSKSIASSTSESRDFGFASLNPPPLQFKTPRKESKRDQKKSNSGQNVDRDFATGGAENPRNHSLASTPFQLKANIQSNTEDRSEVLGQAVQFASPLTTPPPNDQSTNLNLENHNNTGLPAQLKSGIENLSGYSLNDVKVHYNSEKPMQMKAHAFAQGTDIHLASGQEKHLPHEAWHVVQQKQGRVQPTTQLKAFNINDDPSLEKEADEMGNMASSFQMKRESPLGKGHSPSPIIQKVDFEEDSKAAIHNHSDGKNAVTKGMESGPMKALGGAANQTGDTSMGLMKRLGKDKLLNQNLSDSGWDKTSDSYKNAASSNEANGQSGNLGNATKAFNIGGTAAASLSLISSIAGAVDSFKEGDFSDQLISIFDIGADASSLLSGVAGMVADYIPGDAAKTEAGSVSGGAFFMEGVIKTAKGAYKSIKNIYEAVQVHIGGSDDEKFVQSDGREKGERTWEIFTGLLDTGVGIVKMLKHAVSEKFGFLKDSNLSKLGDAAGGNLMPILGLVMGVIDIAQRVIQLIKAGIQKLRIRDKMVSLMSGDGTDEEKKKKIREGKKKVLRTKRQKALDEAEKARELNGLDLDDYSGDDIGTKTSNKEAYDYLKEMDYINGKRQIRASIHIGIDLTSIGGEIANMTGVGATAGVALKAASSAGGVILPVFRKFKQWGRDKAAEQEAGQEGKEKGARGIFKLFDTSKNSDNKKQRIVKDVGFVFRHISGLQGLNEEELPPKVELLQLYVESTGASFSRFLRTFGVKGEDMKRDSQGAVEDVSVNANDDGVKKAAVYLMECMKERE